MAETVPLRIVYLFDDGSVSDLALGTIDARGMIEVGTVAPDQDALVADLVATLNATEDVYTRDVETEPGADRGVIVKTRVARGEPDFPRALKDDARRFHNLDLQFEPALLVSWRGVGDAAGGGGVDAAPPAPESVLSAPDMTPRPDAKPGIED